MNGGGQAVARAGRTAWWWLGAGGVLAACSGAGWAPATTAGLGAGFVVGGLYVWLLLRRTATLHRLPPRQAVAAAQFAAVLRFCFVFAAFGAVARLWPWVHLGAGAGAFLVPLATSMLLLGRRV